MIRPQQRISKKELKGIKNDLSIIIDSRSETTELYEKDYIRTINSGQAELALALLESLESHRFFLQGLMKVAESLETLGPVRIQYKKEQRHCTPAVEDVSSVPEEEGVMHNLIQDSSVNAQEEESIDREDFDFFCITIQTLINDVIDVWKEVTDGSTGAVVAGASKFLRLLLICDFADIQSHQLYLCRNRQLHICCPTAEPSLVQEKLPRKRELFTPWRILKR